MDECTELTVGTQQSTAVATLESRAVEYAKASRSENTKANYKSRLGHFGRWCEVQGRSPIPASPETVALYLTAHAGVLKVSSLAQTLASIAAAHKAANMPFDREGYSLVWQGIRRTHGAPAKGKAALMSRDLYRLVDSIDASTLVGKRDRALLLIGFFGAFRRSELVGLDVGALAGGDGLIEFRDEGLMITLVRSKTDQNGDGQQVAIKRRSHHCPVEALRTWLEAAGIASGAAFQRFHKSGSLLGRLGDSSVRNIVKGHAERVGSPEWADTFGAHSLRSGFCTSAAEGGIALEKLMAHARHTKAETTARYIKRADLFRQNAGDAVE